MLLIVITNLMLCKDPLSFFFKGLLKLQDADHNVILRVSDLITNRSWIVSFLCMRGLEISDVFN